MPADATGISACRLSCFAFPPTLLEPMEESRARLPQPNHLAEPSIAEAVGITSKRASVQ